MIKILSFFTACEEPDHRKANLKVAEAGQKAEFKGRGGRAEGRI